MDFKYDFFISYAHKDNLNGFVDTFTDRLRNNEEFRLMFGTQPRIFFDRTELHSMDDWNLRIRDALASSRFLIVMLSPAYFQSEFCAQEFDWWLDHEMHTHVLGEGTAPLQVVRVDRLFDFSTDTLPDIPDHLREKYPRWVSQLRSYQSNDDFDLHDYAVQHIDRTLRTLKAQTQEKYEKQKLAAKSMLGPNYPQYNRYFVGRREDLRQLRQSLVTSSCMALSAVNGLGGIGKTELSLTYGHAFAWDYGLGRVFIPCEKQTNFPEVLLSAGIDRMYGHELQKGTTAQRLAELVRLLEHKCKTIPNGRLFVILDNVDQPEFLHSLSTTHVPDCLHLIVTTRMPDEKLAGIRTQTVDKLSLSESLELLNNRRPIGTDPDERAAAEEIAKHFDGLTLAVDLAGAYLQARKRISYRQYWDELQKNPAEPPHLQDLPVRHPARCVSAVLTPTIRALSEPARWMLNLASLTAPDFVPIPWLEEFTKEQFRLGGLEDPLGELLDYHLITPTENENLGRIHRMTVFCLEKDADFTAGATAKLRARSESLLKQDVSFWTSGSQAWQLDAIQGIYELLLQNWTPETSEDAVDWALSWTFGTLGDQYTALGMTSSAAAAHNECFRIAEQRVQAMPDSVKAQQDLGASYNRLGDLANASGDTDSAREYCEKSLQISQRLAEAMPDSVRAQRDLGCVYNRIGGLEIYTGNTVSAREYYEKSLQIIQRLAEAMPDNVEAQRDLGTSYNLLGNLANASGNTDSAREYYEKSLHISQRLAEAMPDNVQVQSDLGASYNNLGYLANASGNTDVAREYYEMSLHIIQHLAEAMPESVQVQRELGVSYSRLGDIDNALGNIVSAREYYEKSLHISQRLAEAMPDNVQVQRDLGISYDRLGYLANASGNTDSAREYYEKYQQISQRLAEAMPDSVLVQGDLAASYNRMWAVAYKFGDLEEAEVWGELLLTQMQMLARKWPENIQFRQDLRKALQLLVFIRTKIAEERKRRGGIFSIFRRFFGK